MAYPQSFSPDVRTEARRAELAMGWGREVKSSLFDCKDHPWAGVENTPWLFGMGQRVQGALECTEKGMWFQEVGL